MLKLLFQTRLRYYLNFIRAHFSRRLQIEIGLLALLGLYLVLRSPADIGYRLDGIFTENTPAKLETWAGLLWLFYVLAETAAFVTLRPTSDWDLLVGLPVSQKTFAGYYLLRFFLKISPLFFIGTVTFFGGNGPWFSRVFAFLLANSILLNAGLLAFSQARRLRRRGGFWRWLKVEIPIFILLISATKIFCELPAFPLPGWLVFSLIPCGIILRFLLRSFSPENFTGSSRQSGAWLSGQTLWRFSRSTSLACSINDFYFLFRKKRSVFWALGLETFVVAASVISQTELAAALISSVFIQILFSWLLVLNLILVLFERDAKLHIYRNLPIRAAQVWLGRWFLVAFFCAVPLVPALAIAAIKFPLTLQLPLFGVAIFFLIPAVLATIFCNTGFALFPQANLAGYLMNFSILLVILFWFYMPFGSLLILGIMLFWIRKSQRHFQLAEI